MRFSRLKVAAELIEELGLLLESGLTGAEACRELLDSFGDTLWESDLARMHQNMQGGYSLAEALESLKECMPQGFEEVIEVIDKTDQPGEFLRQYGAELHQDAEIRGGIRQSLSYPMALLMAGGILVTYTAAVTMGPARRMFWEMDIEVPFVTTLFLAGFPIGIGIVMMLVALSHWFLPGRVFRTPFSRLRKVDWINAFERLFFSWPHALDLARIAERFRLMLAGGRSFKEIAAIFCKTATTGVEKDAWECVIGGLDSGCTLAESFYAGPNVFFTGSWMEILKAAEKEKNYEGALAALRDLYREVAARRAHTFVLILKPLATLAVAGGVIFCFCTVVFGIFAPLLSLMTNMGMGVSPPRGAKDILEPLMYGCGFLVFLLSAWVWSWLWSLPERLVEKRKAFIAHLKRLFDFGFSFAQAIEILAFEDGYYKKRLHKISTYIAEGHDLREIFQKYGRRILPFHIWSILVSAIEAGQPLEGIGRSQEALSAGRSPYSRIWETLLHPMVIIVPLVPVFLLLVTVILPKYNRMFTEMGMVTWGGGIPVYIFAVVILEIMLTVFLLLLLFIAFPHLYQGFAGLMSLREKAIMIVPAVGAALKYELLASFFSSLRFHLDRGLTEEAAVALAADCRSPWLARRGRAVCRQLARGVPLPDALYKLGGGRKLHLFAESFSVLRGRGFLAGLQTFSSLAADASERRLLIVGQIASPLMLALVGLATGLTVIAFFKPLVQIAEGLLISYF